MAEASDVDLIVLGGGSGGYACSLRAAELGMKVALIERDKLGGTCLHKGCIPTKALLHTAEIADGVTEGQVFGVHATLDNIDMGGVNAYKDRVVSRLWKGLQSLVAMRKIELVYGEGRLVSPTSVRVGDRVITGRHVVLATGSTPRSLPGLDIDGVRVITSDHALQLGYIPKKAIVLGGGVIGLEFASVWRSFGADVAIIEALPRLLANEDEFCSKQIERAYRRRKIRFDLDARFASAAVTDDGVSVTLENGAVMDADLLLVAVGRGPVSQGLGYEEAGVAMERGFVLADEYCRTNVETISAVGDLIPTLQLAHVGFAEGIMVAERVSGMSPPPVDYDAVPRVTYSRPEVASVGLTSAQARERGHETDEFTYDLAGNGRAQILQEAGGVKVIAEKGGGPVLGIHMVGPRVGDLIAEAQLIYGWEATPLDVAQHIHAHPTLSEAVGEAHLALAGKPLHVHG